MENAWKCNRHKINEIIKNSNLDNFVAVAVAVAVAVTLNIYAGCEKKKNEKCLSYGLAVRVSVSQAEDPGSTPGARFLSITNNCDKMICFYTEIVDVGTSAVQKSGPRILMLVIGMAAPNGHDVAN
uniref:Uncharacterized protein n=1 Tax=Glossina austeni TaxID=7395 RepID=A0A1A9UT57_GLOAU